jgi:aminopeptidase N
MQRHLVTLFFLLLSLAPGAQAQRGRFREGNPFAPPQATVHYAPDRDYDLLHVAIDLQVDAAKQTFKGTVVNTLATLHDGLKSITLHCGENLNVQECLLGGRKTTFTRAGEPLQVASPNPCPRVSRSP